MHNYYDIRIQNNNKLNIKMLKKNIRFKNRENNQKISNARDKVFTL